MTSPSPDIFDRTLLRIRRNRRARQSGTADFLLQAVAAEVADRLDSINREFETSVAYNAADGTLARAMADTGKAGWICSADLAEDQLSAAPPPHAVLDEERLAIAPGRLALFVSGLTLHLADDLPGALIQIRQALRPDGLFLGALFGGDTLSELRQAFLAAETEMTGGVSPRVAPFADVRDLGGLLQRAGFALPVVDTDRLTARYGSALELMHDLRAMGATSVLRERSRTPLTRSLLMKVAETYHALHADPDGRIPATFQIVYLTGWAPHESQQKPLAPGSAEKSLAGALGTEEQKFSR
ncbi:MAG: SAM-dependent methyltransferase [Hyphomicrobiales bacterium]